jgi:hypothetical protein
LAHQCFQVSEPAVGDNHVASNSHGIAFRLPDDLTIVQNEVSFFASYHQLPTNPQ